MQSEIQLACSLFNKYFEIIIQFINTSHRIIENWMSAKIRIKPNLSIEVNEEQNQQLNGESMRILQATKSAKNNHELKRFNFCQVKPQEKIRKQQKIQKLEKQKAQLLLSLEILKNGAVSAILQKDEIINKLRKLFAQSQQNNGQDANNSKMQELQNLLQYIKDLEEDRVFLKDQAERQKQIFQQAILQREEIIEDLTQELNWSNERIQNLQKYQELLEEKLQTIEQNNSNLKILLNQSQDLLREERKKLNQSNMLSKNKSASSINVGSDLQNSGYLTKELRKINNSAGLNDSDFSIHINKSLDESVIQSKIQQIKNQHYVEIRDLTYFYESRLETLRKLCENYPQLQYTSANSKSINNSKYEPQKYLNTQQGIEDRSNYSNFTIETGKESMLKKNLSLGSFKSGGPIRIMDPIDEKEEIEKIPMRRSLKKEILSFQNFHMERSEKSNKSSSQSSVNQKKSSFSNRYFEYPSSNFKKNKSQKSLKHSQSNTQPKIQSQSLRTHTEPLKQSHRDIIYSTIKGSKNKIEEEGKFWDKLFWFTTGTLTGGLLLTVGNKIWK